MPIKIKIKISYLGLNSLSLDFLKYSGTAAPTALEGRLVLCVGCRVTVRESVPPTG